MHLIIYVHERIVIQNGTKQHDVIERVTVVSVIAQNRRVEVICLILVVT